MNIFDGARLFQGVFVFKKIILVGALAVFVAGCARDRYTYNNEDFSTPADALAAQAVHVDGLLKNIKVRDQSIDAKILVVTPTQSAHVALGITRKGSPKQEMIDYMGQSSERSFQAMGQALQKSKTFTQVDVTLAEHTLKAARQQIGNYSAVVYFHLLSPTQYGWYLLKQNNETPIQINLDPLAKGADRVESWIASIETNFKTK